MTSDILSREQRLRKQAELQSLYTNLASLREREASYISASAPVPDLLLKQLNELRHQIESVENALAALEHQSVRPLAQDYYHQAFEAELKGNYSDAINLYRSANRHGHPDAGPALRSVRYQSKLAKGKLAAAGQPWPPASGSSSQNHILIVVAVILVLALITGFFLFGGVPSSPDQGIALASTATVSATLLPPTNTPNLLPTPTHTATPVPTVAPTSTPISNQVAPTDTPTPANTNTPTPTPTLALRPAPKIIGPKDGLVWGDGTIVFEFEDAKLAYDELYCLNTLRGYDRTNTENWSYEPVGRKNPAIPIEANAFHVAKSQDIQCIVWSAYLASDTCDNVISESTEERVIGLPHPCKFDKD